MGFARDEAGHIWETDAQGQPVRLAQPAQGGGQAGQVFTMPKDPTKDALAQAQLANAQLEAQKKQRDLQNDPNTPFSDPNDALTGNDYLAKLPRQQADQVRALADGRMAFPTGKAAASPYWQRMLSAVAHYDPNFDAVNYNARASARKDFTSGTSARNIRALNTAIGHVGQLSDQIDGTASHGGFPFATTVNAVENAARRGFGDSGPTNFDQTRSAVASELTQVFRGSGGAEADVKRYLEELSSAGSEEQKRAAIKNIAGLLNSRLSEIGDQYSKAMGKTTDPVQLLNPHAQKIWSKILGPDGGAGGEGGSGGPGGGAPGSGPAAPTLGLATGGQKFTPDEAGSRLATELARNGMSDEQINAALTAANLDPLQPKSIASVRAYLKQNPGFKGVVPGVGKTEDTSLFNRAATSPAGAFVGSYLDGATAGGVSALVGQEGRDKLQALEGDNPKSAFAGGALGGLTATVGAGKLLGATRLAPWLAQNVGKAALAGDAAYGGAYGFNTADDGNGLAGAGIGTVAGLAGHGLGSGAAQLTGRFARGVVDPSVQYLKSRGIDMTGGQMLGGFFKNAEDKLTSLPGVGGMIGRRRREGLGQFNRAAFDDAGKPIGFVANQTGSAGVDDLLGATGNAYDSATRGITVPMDAQAGVDLRGALSAGQNLPDDLQRRFALAMENRVKPAVDSGQMTGEGYQQAVRGLKSYKAEAPKPGFEADYRDALTSAQDALTDNMNRNGGPDVVSGLQSADQSYKMGKVLQDAVKRARNGARSGEPEVFTPSQLADAAEANRFSGGGTSRPFYDLSKAGQQVLPSQVPDSGTAGRHIAGLLATGGLGAGIDYANPGDGGEATGIGLGSLGVMAALNSKAGRTALEKILLERPDIARRLGTGLIGKSSYAGALGRGGAVTLPSILGN